MILSKPIKGTKRLYGHGSVLLYDLITAKKNEPESNLCDFVKKYIMYSIDSKYNSILRRGGGS